MCVTSNVTCGVCLGKWNGKAWESTYSCILPLKKWSVSLNKKFQIYVEGYNDDLGSEMFTLPIKKRINSRWVASDTILVKLDGPLLSKELPGLIVDKFRDGVPANWKDVVNKWMEFLRQGRSSSSYSWTGEESFSSNTTQVTIRNRRTIPSGEDKDGKPKDKQTPRKQISQGSIVDSGVPESEQRNTKPLPDFCPPTSWLPPHKVKAINQWINRSPTTAHIPPEAMDIHTDDGHTGSLSHSASERDRLASAGARTSLEVLQSTSDSSDGGRRKNGMDNKQSTPLRFAEDDTSYLLDTVNFSLMSSISSIGNTTGLSSSLNDSMSEGVFRRPKQNAAGARTAAKDEPKSVPKGAAAAEPPEEMLRRSHAVPRTPAKNVELPGAKMARMESLSASLRPRRKVICQRIERWRPVLSVDQSLRLQGYLLLRGDMTAGQILTTNPVKEWQNRMVKTTDGKEYELVGELYDPSGKIPLDLRDKLHTSLDYKEIVQKLKLTQSLRDRADWSTEYEYVYDLNTNNNSHSRVLETPKTGSRTTRRSMQRSKSTGSRPQRPTRTTGENVSPFNNTPRASLPRRKIFERTNAEHGKESPQLLNKEPSLHNSTGCIVRRNVKAVRSLSLPASAKSLRRGVKANAASPVTVNGEQSAGHDEKFTTSKNSPSVPSAPNVGHACIDNVTWKNPQSQIKDSDTGLANGSTIVSYMSSPSHIKVSYAKPSLGAKCLGADMSLQSKLAVKTSEPDVTGGVTTRSRPLRSPTKRACLPCQGPHPSPPVVSHSPPGAPRTRRASKSAEHNQSNSVQSTCPLTKSHSYPTRNLRSAHTKESLNTSCNLPSPRALRSGRSREMPRVLKSPSSPGVRTTRHVHHMLNAMVSPRTKYALRTHGSPHVKLQRFDKRATGRSPKMAVDAQPQGKKKQRTRSMPKMDQRERRERRRVKTSEPENTTKEISKKVKSSEENRKNMKVPEESRSSKRKSSTKKQTSVQRTKRVKRKRTAVQENEDLSATEESEIEAGEDKASVGSDAASDISVGPSASVIFALRAESPTSQRAPRTLRERRERDADFERLGELAAAISKDDDPLAEIMSAQKYAPLPEEWCDHRTLLRQNRVQRRPSSSDGTASPSRSGLDDGFGNEDATSSVATPQLLMRKPDPKQVQSYLQRQRALNARPQRPTRHHKPDKSMALPYMDYAAPFQRQSSESEYSSREGSEDEEEML